MNKAEDRLALEEDVYSCRHEGLPDDLCSGNLHEEGVPAADVLVDE